ncbi:MAG: mandelate racemase/muconate lactonizing enzyme family protein [Actinomycetes bacterium]
MKISDIRLHRLLEPLQPAFNAAWDPLPRTSFAATLVEVVTDEGVVGYGSGDTMDGFEQFVDMFVGQDLFAVTRHVRTLETITFHYGRYWPLEAAIWDAIGKALQVPVAVLFGGALDRIPAYASTGEIRTPEERLESALALRERGFRAMKVRVRQSDLDLGLRTMRTLREGLGDSMDLMVDLNQSWRMAGDTRASLDPTTVARFADALAELGVFWLEEPLPLDDVRGLQMLRGRGVRVAGGEMVRSLPEMLALVDADAVDVLQPDVVLAIGMERSRMLAGLALARNRLFTPHTWSNGLGLLANLHVTAGVGGGPYLEFPLDPPNWTEQRRDFFLAEPVTVDGDGCLRVPDRPGLGGEPDPEALARFAVR